MKKFDTEIRLSREMTLLDATMIGVGAMIGAGIFVLIGIAAGVAGPALILAFALNGVVALLTAMSYAELGSCYHDAGGGYLWVKEGLPKWNGFLSGWMSWFAHAVACSLYALGFGAYFGHVLHELGVVLPTWGFLSPQKLLAAIIAVIFAYINFRGASETGKIGNIVTMAKIVILAIFIGFGIEFIIRGGNWRQSLTPFMPNGFGGVFKAMGLTFIAFQGFEVIAQSSEEIKNPKKNIPRAVFLSLMIVVPIYLLIAVTALGSVRTENMTPWDYLAQFKETALVEVARNFFWGGGVMILVGGLVSTMSALNATIYSSSRVAFAMGRDHNFPTFLSKVHSKRFTPYMAIIASIIIVVLMTISFHIEVVASSADIMFLLLFLQVNLAMIRLRKKRPDLDRGFLMPLFPWLSIIGIAMLVFLAVYMFSYSITAWGVTAFWLISGLVVFKVYASKREVEHIHKVESLERIEKKEYRILVCISNPKSIKSMSNVAFALARKHNAEVVFLHIIEVQEGQKLMSGLAETNRIQPTLDEAESLAEKSGIKARSLIKISHKISQSIIDTAIEEKCNFIVIKRQKRPSMLDRLFSSLIDTVLQKSPSEVAVLHGDLPSGDIKTIMIPFGTNIHTRLALEIAPALLEFFKANLRVVLVIDPDLPKIEQEKKIRDFNKILTDYSFNASIEVIKNRDIVKGITSRSADVDLVLMGGRSGDLLELLIAGSLTQNITEEIHCPVLWVKEYEERQSFLASIIRPNKEGGA